MLLSEIEGSCGDMGDAIVDPVFVKLGASRVATGTPVLWTVVESSSRRVARPALYAEPSPAFLPES